MWTRAVASRILSLWLLLPTLVIYSALAAPPPSFPLPTDATQLLPRDRYILRNDTFKGTLQAFNPVTRELVPQGPATDGSGTGRDAPAIVWLTFTFVVGVPLSLVGFRGWRLTTGVGVGLAAAVAPWAAFINTVNATGISDLFLTIIVLAFFVAGFFGGCFELGKATGMTLLGMMGGMSFGVRLMLLRSGLLLPVGDDGSGTGYTISWIIIAFLSLIGGLSVVWIKYQRIGLLLACASTGTFLTSLGVDLILHRQTGMSRGLIFLFDRNSSHIVDVITKGYNPSVTTQIILGVSLGLIPILAYAQHLIFKAPFDRRRLSSDSDIILSDDPDTTPRPSSSTGGGGILMRHRQNASKMLSGLWDGALFKGKNSNRFSV